MLADTSSRMPRLRRHQVALLALGLLALVMISISGYDHDEEDETVATRSISSWTRRFHQKPFSSNDDDDYDGRDIRTVDFVAERNWTSSRVNDDPELKLSGYLDKHFDKTSPTRPHIWITLSSDEWLDRGTTALQAFIDQMNWERADFYGQVRRTELVVLCLDQVCMDVARKKKMNAYGGYQTTRPEQILVATWPKLAGVIDALEAGWDVFFVDSDVFFKSSVSLLGAYRGITLTWL